MLNTLMAICNQDRGANRQRIVKVVFTILFIIGSASLFLFTLNSSAWSPFAGAQGQRIQREQQPPPTTSNSHSTVLASHTPIASTSIRTASITPTTTRAVTKLLCVRAPAVVKSQNPPAIPQNVMTYADPNTISNGNSEQKQVDPKTVHVPKGKHPSKHVPKVPVTSTPLSHTTKIAPAVPSVLPIIPPTIEPTVLTTPTVDTSATVTPANGTTTTDVPAIVTTNATPTQFTSSLRSRGALQTAISPLINVGTKSTGKKNGHTHKYVQCSKSTTHKSGGQHTAPHVEQHARLLLGGSLLVILFSSCLAFVFRREE